MRKLNVFSIGGFVLVCLLLFAGCTGKKESTTPSGGESSMKISSSAFVHAGTIPSKYTCAGADISPPLTFSNIPEDVESLALIVDDPDAPAGTWVHWVVWNIPAEVSKLEEDEKITYSRGKNDFGKLEYGGPCPPSGTHRYFFKLYALDTTLDLQEGATKARLVDAMDGHILAEATLMGKYSR